jgi:hypothetical protein
MFLYNIELRCTYSSGVFRLHDSGRAAGLVADAPYQMSLVIYVRLRPASKSRLESVKASFTDV